MRSKNLFTTEDTEAHRGLYVDAFYPEVGFLRYIWEMVAFVYQ